MNNKIEDQFTRDMDTPRDLVEEYTYLLSKRDQLLKDAESYKINYTREFGGQMIANFELKLECIRIKKSISYCRRILNRGLPINVESMKASVEKEMLIHKLQLDDLQSEFKRAGEARNVDSFTHNRAKKIYRKLCKLIHPDVNAKTESNENLLELWEKIKTAYFTSDVDMLEDLEILVKQALEELGEEGFEADLNNLEERIERVEAQIEDIISTEPYTYGRILESCESIEELHNTLTAEHDDFADYRELLEKALNELLAGTGLSTTWTL
ncbi:MAG: J domain-containing protein [Lachnospiraceae bacterium]|nr:J domain-containing protein [Lachnospiraceae bacterium]